MMIQSLPLGLKQIKTFSYRLRSNGFDGKEVTIASQPFEKTNKGIEVA